MTIRKGQDWGRPGPLPSDGIVVHSDSEARAAITRARAEERSLPVLGLLGGDLARCVGSTGDAARLHSERARTVEVDLGEVEVDGVAHVFVAHLVARRALWAGRFVVAMNAEHIGTWKVAPRAHPNDGELDLLEGSLSLDDRLKARRRLPAGDHLPHPGIATRRVSTVEIDFDRPTAVHLDGEKIGAGRHLRIQVVPDALTCVV